MVQMSYTNTLTLRNNLASMKHKCNRNKLTNIYKTNNYEQNLYL